MTVLMQKNLMNILCAAAVHGSLQIFVNVNLNVHNFFSKHVEILHLWTHWYMFSISGLKYPYLVYFLKHFAAVH